jgi:hypothetical protein
MWAHYADSHKGICLGFEIAEDYYKEVNYISEPLPFAGPSLETVNQMLYTKFDDWKYEGEVRIAATLEEKENGLAFKNFDEHMTLNSVIVGAACFVEFETVQRAVGPYACSVSITKARRSWTKFEMEVETQKHRDHDRMMKERRPITDSLGSKGVEVRFPKVGPNDPCPCGNGKKYKRCHGK